MATVTGMTAEKIVEITDDAVVSAAIDSATGILTLQTRGGQTLTVGSVENSDAVTNAVNAAYPVGSIFMSTIATNPATQLGVGTWAAWGTGRVPVGVDAAQTEFNTTEKTGGAKTHVLTATNLPTHTHTMNHDHPSFTTPLTGDHAHQLSFSNNTGSSASNIPKGTTTTDTNFSGPVGQNGAHQHTIDVPYYDGSTGSGNGLNSTAVNHLPPYITCYMWKRTA